MHIVLILVELPHPHTGEDLADSLLDCMQDWNITHEVLLFITDNCANIIKPVKIINEKAKHFEQNQQNSASWCENIDASPDDEGNFSDTDDNYDDEVQTDEDRENEDNKQVEFDGSYNNIENDFADLNEDLDATDMFYSMMKCMAHSFQ